MNQLSHLLVVEDVEEDAVLIAHALRREGVMPHWRRVDTRTALEAALKEQAWDIVIADYFMPTLNGLDVIASVNTMAPGTPVIIVSGTLSERAAVDAMRAGAQDFFLKGKIDRLPLAVARELEDAEIRRQNLEAGVAMHALHLQALDANIRLRRLSSQIIQVQEKERHRLAQDLHDDVGQSLIALKMTLDGVRKRGTLDADAQRSIDQGRELVTGVIDQVRNLSLALRPPQLDDLGLAEALRFHVERQANLGSIVLRFESDHLEPRAHPDIESTCFRITQEVMTNIIKHASASQVRCKLADQGSALRLTIQDDGCGFNVESALRQAARGESAGLLNMQERAALVGGCVLIESDPVGGTRFDLVLPKIPIPFSV